MYLHYAKPYLLLATIITLISWVIVYNKGSAATGRMLYLKLITLVIGLVLLRRRHRSDIFFYQNIGYGERQLLTVIGTADLSVWLVGIIVLINTLPDGDPARQCFFDLWL
ncbi:hypothetical protein FUA23_02250 [Neolewinella aurantiaca]|uniref:Uncharacterized protein n=1 Tax=Neolewinella aurantiaca TaxID=2602767 RepID=A0A5C7G0B4_9BACT|nr:hypothetical protein [Neolewinella aurantiaca]TXF91540.1 hypothetical protein FUA23_02250 [Neolewinella aurantiaca]